MVDRPKSLFDMKLWDKTSDYHKRRVFKEIARRLEIYEAIAAGELSSTRRWIPDCQLCGFARSAMRRLLEVGGHCRICPIYRCGGCSSPARLSAIHYRDKEAALIRHAEIVKALEDNGFEYK